MISTCRITPPPLSIRSSERKYEYQTYACIFRHFTKLIIFFFWFHRPTKKGKSREIGVNAEISDNDNNANDVSDDWDEEQLKVAIQQSRYVDLTNFQFFSSWTLRSISKTIGGIAEGSKDGKRKANDIDDPFTDFGSKNAMPSPSRPKKIFLEDYENFVVE